MTVGISVPLSVFYKEQIWSHPLPEFQCLKLRVSVAPSSETLKEFQIAVSLDNIEQRRFLDIESTVGSRIRVRAVVEFSSDRLSHTLHFGVSLNELKQDPGAIVNEELHIRMTVKDYRPTTCPEGIGKRYHVHTCPCNEYIGLPNLGATCYMNALLQCLFHLPAFRKLVYQHQSPSDVIQALQRLFYGMQTKQTGVNTRELIEALGRSEWQCQIQQDVVDFLRCLFRLLDPDLLVLFRIEMIVRVTNSVDAKNEPMYTLPLTVDGCSSVQESFDLLLTPQALDYEYKTLSFGLIPKVLILHLQRFKIAHGRAPKKLNDFYRFPEDLHLTTLGPGYDQIEYTLFSIIVHSGGVDSGHYTALVCPKTGDNQWYEFNDRSVRKVSNAWAINRNYGGSDRIFSAYVLMYVQKAAIDELFCAIPAVPSGLRAFGSACYATYFTAWIVTEDTISCNSLNGEHPLQVTGTEKCVSLDHGISCQLVYERLASLYQTSPQRIRLWNVKNGVIDKSLQRVGKIANTMSQVWFLEQSTWGLCSDDDLSRHVLIFLYFRFSDRYPVQFIGAREFNKSLTLCQIYSDVSLIVGFDFQPPLVCYLNNRPDPLNANYSLLELMLPHGSSLTFEVDPELGMIPEFTFQVRERHENDALAQGKSKLHI